MEGSRVSDLREKQPIEKTLDLRSDTFGNHQWSALIRVSPYFGIKNEDVYPRFLTITFNAPNFRAAHGFAQSVSAAISLAHDIWQTNIEKLWEDAA